MALQLDHLGQKKGYTLSKAKEFKLEMEHLQKVQRTIRKAGNIFPNESELLTTLEDIINKAQDDNALNTYHSMAKYLTTQLKELKSHLERPLDSVEEALVDLEWSVNYLQWLVTENEDYKETT